MKYQNVAGALPLGFQLGGYRIDRILGDGSFGIVYLATVAGDGMKYALKELYPKSLVTRAEDSSVFVTLEENRDDLDYMREMFHAEAKLLSTLRHASFTSYIDDFTALGTSYLVMKYESGFDLGHYIKNGQVMSEEEMFAFFIPLLEGLETLHNNGYIHRDIKPQNIYSAPGNHAVLIDFGAAMKIDTQLSHPPDGIFSDQFAPIEQYVNDGGMGAWTDIYALAAVMYYMITGNKPPHAVKRDEGKQPLIPLTSMSLEGYNPHFLAAIDAALAHQVADRTQSAASFAKQLKQTKIQSLGNSLLAVTPAEHWWSTQGESGLITPKRIAFIVLAVLALLLLCAIIVESMS
ncbi:MAG: serine/threonine protein kinase [Akkermansiaceae bacterium]